MSLCPVSHWRHGSTAPQRALTRDEKRERYWELRASHKRVALRRGLRPLVREAEEFYREAFGEVLDERVAPGLVFDPGLGLSPDDFGLPGRPSVFLGRERRAKA